MPLPPPVTTTTLVGTIAPMNAELAETAENRRLVLCDLCVDVWVTTLGLRAARASTPAASSTSFLTVRDAANRTTASSRRENRHDVHRRVQPFGAERLERPEIEPFRLADQAAEFRRHQRAKRHRLDRAGRARLWNVK